MISAALVSLDQTISVMINEEDHIREQYFMKGFDLKRAYERIAGIDDIISDSIPFAYDRELGYLTACPSNLGTGLRASVMLFLPALIPTLTRLGLTVRGVFGEGSGADGDLFQISNEVTLGLSEEEVLFGVEQAVSVIVEAELLERERMMAEEGMALKDRLRRSLGILLSCCLLDEKELARRIADVKLGVALGFFGAEAGQDRRLETLDNIAMELRPAGMDRLAKRKLTEEEGLSFRAEYVRKKISSLHFIL